MRFPFLNVDAIKLNKNENWNKKALGGNKKPVEEKSCAITLSKEKKSGFITRIAFLS